jgi:hypothetical protein
MSYVKIDDAIDIILKYGRNWWLCKYDISNVFKNCPITPSQWPMFCVKWNSLYYFYVRLTFGCRSSPIIVDTLSQAICYIAKNNYKVNNILHLLDDFLTIDPPPHADGEWYSPHCTTDTNRLPLVSLNSSALYIFLDVDFFSNLRDSWPPQWCSNISDKHFDFDSK